jgi:hypothetical protein
MWRFPKRLWQTDSLCGYCVGRCPFYVCVCVCIYIYIYIYILHDVSGVGSAPSSGYWMSYWHICYYLWTVFWAVAPCSFVETYRRFRGANSVHHRVNTCLYVDVRYNGWAATCTPKIIKAGRNIETEQQQEVRQHNYNPSPDDEVTVSSRNVVYSLSVDNVQHDIRTMYTWRLRTGPRSLSYRLLHGHPVSMQSVRHVTHACVLASPTVAACDCCSLFGPSRNKFIYRCCHARTTQKWVVTLKIARVPTIRMAAGIKMFGQPRVKQK